MPVATHRISNYGIDIPDAKRLDDSFLSASVIFVRTEGNRGPSNGAGYFEDVSVSLGTFDGDEDS